MPRPRSPPCWRPSRRSTASTPRFAAGAQVRAVLWTFTQARRPTGQRALPFCARLGRTTRRGPGKGGHRERHGAGNAFASHRSSRRNIPLVCWRTRGCSGSRCCVREAACARERHVDGRTYGVPSARARSTSCGPRTRPPTPEACSAAPSSARGMCNGTTGTVARPLRTRPDGAACAEADMHPSDGRRSSCPQPPAEEQR